MALSADLAAIAHFHGASTMAGTSSFKQRCPSCEAMISVKESQIGKKIECTKCKDTFIAEAPEDEIEIVEEEKQVKKSKKADKSTAITSKAAAGKRPKLEVVEEIDDIIEEVEDDEAPAKGKSKSKGKPHKDDDDEDVDEIEEVDEAPKKKKDNANSNKLTIGLGLAVVGVIILCVAAFFLLRGGRQPAGGGIVIPPGGGGNEIVEDKDKKDKKTPKKLDTKLPDVVAAQPLNDAERAKLTNLLPPDTEHVFHVFFDALFPVGGPLREIAFQASALDDAELKQRLGFSLLAIDDIILAERYSSRWR